MSGIAIKNRHKCNIYVWKSIFVVELSVNLPYINLVITDWTFLMGSAHLWLWVMTGGRLGLRLSFLTSRLLTLRSPSVLLYDWWITESCTVLPVAALSRYFALLYYLPYKQQMVSFPNLDFNIWSWFLCSLFHWKALNCQSNFFDPDNLAIFFFTSYTIFYWPSDWFIIFQNEW